MHIYIYIERERERERERDSYMYIYIYIYIKREREREIRVCESICHHNRPEGVAYGSFCLESTVFLYIILFYYYDYYNIHMSYY